MLRLGLTALTLLAWMTSCSTTRPCSEAGDVAWQNTIEGDRHCQQKKLKNGTWTNHGKFKQSYPNGKTALEGEFVEGQKNGYWTQYDESGKKKVERYYEKGVERSSPTLPPSSGGNSSGSGR